MAMHKFVGSQIAEGDELKNSLGAAPTIYKCNNIVQNYDLNNINFPDEGGGCPLGWANSAALYLCIYEIRIAQKFIMLKELPFLSQLMAQKYASNRAININ